MYHLKCSYYKKKFNTIYELLDDIVLSGMDPNYLVYKDGKSVGTKAIDLIQILSSAVGEVVSKELPLFSKD